MNRRTILSFLVSLPFVSKIAAASSKSHLARVETKVTPDTIQFTATCISEVVYARCAMTVDNPSGVIFHSPINNPFRKELRELAMKGVVGETSRVHSLHYGAQDSAFQYDHKGNWIENPILPQKPHKSVCRWTTSLFAKECITERNPGGLVFYGPAGNSDFCTYILARDLGIGESHHMWSRNRYAPHSPYLRDHNTGD